MKIFLVVAVIALLAVAGTAYVIVPRYALELIKNYDPYTFERVLEDDTIKINYAIYNNISPADYGFDAYEEVTYSSIFDGNQLSSWYVPTKESSKRTILIIHGRWSN